MSSERKPGRPRIHEGGGVKQILYIPAATFTWLKEESKRTSRPMSQIVAEALTLLKGKS